MTSIERDTRAELERASQAAHFPVGVFWTDLNGRCIRVNARWTELSGLSERRSLGFGWTSAIHPEDRERVAAEQARHLELGKNMTIEFRLLRPGGRVVWVLSQSVASYTEAGLLNGFVGTVTDITDRVRTEEALRQSEERFRGLVELAPDFVAIHRGGILQYVNEAGCQMMRASGPADLVGRHILEFVLPEYQAVAGQRMSELQKGEAIPLAEMEARLRYNIPLTLGLVVVLL